MKASSQGLLEKSLFTGNDFIPNSFPKIHIVYKPTMHLLKGRVAGTNALYCMQRIYKAMRSSYKSMSDFTTLEKINNINLNHKEQNFQNSKKNKHKPYGDLRFFRHSIRKLFTKTHKNGAHNITERLVRHW